MNKAVVSPGLFADRAEGGGTRRGYVAPRLLLASGRVRREKSLAPGIAAGSTYWLNSVREWFPVPSHRNCKIARITFSPTAAQGCASYFSEL
jgi:hypothetical protein